MCLLNGYQVFKQKLICRFLYKIFLKEITFQKPCYAFYIFELENKSKACLHNQQ